MTAAAAVGVLADRALGEPPTVVHPVAWFGRAMTALERWTWRDHRLAGVAHTAIGVGGAWLVGVALTRAVGRTAATALATSVAVAGRMLDAEALAVADVLAAGDLNAARRRVSALVGRDPSGLDGSALARAVVESVAENTTDAVVAPVVWAAVGGAPAVLAHRAVNTLDAMVGHRSLRYARFGWSAARLDDIVNAVPAVVGAVVVAARHPGRWRVIGRAVVVDAGRHPSPNAGLIEAAYAGALGVTLGGANRYAGRLEDRGRLGSGPPPVPADIARAVRLRRWVGLALTGALFALDLGASVLCHRTSPRGRVRFTPERRQRSVRRRPRRRSHDRLASSSQLTASARRSVVAT